MTSTSPAFSQSTDGCLNIALSGKIDERFDGNRIIGALDGASSVVLDLAAVRAVSSLGVRVFEGLVKAIIGELSAEPKRVELVRVPPALATQLTLIPNLLNGARIVSALLPFACTRCGNEQRGEVPWKTGAHRDHAPACSACGAKTELDGMPEQYLPS